MKSEIIEEKKEDIKYPCLMKSNGNERIVLFSSKNSGVVIVPDDNMAYGVGYYSNNFDISCYHMFEGKVILQND